MSKNFCKLFLESIIFGLHVTLECIITLVCFLADLFNGSIQDFFNSSNLFLDLFVISSHNGLDWSHNTSEAVIDVCISNVGSQHKHLCV